jgi:uncharacterized FlaG/YvyC family protein
MKKREKDMAISPINSNILVTASTPTPPVVPGQASRQVASAVQTLNDNNSAGPGRQFSIAIDAKSKLPVVRIVDSSTNELIEQIPSQYILDLAQEINQETTSNLASGGR